MKKKTLIMLLASILCIALLPAVAHAATPDVWDGSTASSLTGGGKSEDDPYLISTGAELKLLADNSRATGLGSCYVKLTNDIVLNDGTFDKSGAFTKRGATTTSQPNEWLPMGVASWHIDGNGHSISGMYINRNDAMVGLISEIKDGGYIRNLTIKDSYHNMKQCILPHMEIVDRAKAAMKAAGLQPREVPIRGGTDGARLSFEGLPCPNICTGTANMHGKFEFVCTEDMQKITDILCCLVGLYAKKP